MSEQRASEISRREQAQARAGEIVAGSGKRGNPRRMARMASARLDGELFRKLQLVAQHRNTTVSDLLREGAELIVENVYADTVTLKVTKSEGTGGSIQRGQGKGNIVTARSQTSIVTTTTRHNLQPTTV